MDEATLRNIVGEAGKICDDGKYVEELRLLSESFTHLKDAEYVPSFVMGWSIIERYISQKWKKRLDENEIDGERASKLVNSNQWPVDNQLEVLNLSKDIDDTEYDNFMELKRKRNNLIHKGKQIAKEDAERWAGPDPQNRIGLRLFVLYLLFENVMLSLLCIQ